MAVTRTMFVAALAGCGLLLGCQDDAEKALSEAGVSKEQLTQSREAAPPTPRSALQPPGEPARNSEVPGGLGPYEVVSDPARGRVEIRFAPETTGPQNAVLWLAGPDGPVSVGLEPCEAEGARCLAGRSELLRNPAWRGVLRFEMGGQRCRISLGATRPETQPAPSRKSSLTQPEST